MLNKADRDEVFWTVFTSFFGEIYHCGNKLEYNEEDFKEA